MVYETKVDWEYEQKCSTSYEEECSGYGYHQECEQVKCGLGHIQDSCFGGGGGDENVLLASHFNLDLCVLDGSFCFVIVNKFVSYIIGLVALKKQKTATSSS